MPIQNSTKAPSSKVTAGTIAALIAAPVASWITTTFHLSASATTEEFIKGVIIAVLTALAAGLAGWLKRENNPTVSAFVDFAARELFDAPAVADAPGRAVVDAPAPSSAPSPVAPENIVDAPNLEPAPAT